MEKIKELMTLYNKAQLASQEATALRKQLIPLVKSAGLTGTKFDFGDRSISYHNYHNYEDITQKLLKRVLAEKYPRMNAEQFIKDVYDSRIRKDVDTLRVHVSSNSKSK